ncbi:MAG TPA: hypothetical protein VEW90_07390 [Gaiellaceae bacterium]|nr:hypothetical protein [Gaiellaceae bacterium]
MRAWLYGALGGLVAFVALAMVLGEARGGGSIAGWEVLLAVAAVAAMFAIGLLAVVAVVYELRIWRDRRTARA